MTTAVNPNPQRYEFLDAIRGVAALMVALFHCALPTQIPTFPLAGYCVDVFFVLSGFVIAASYQRKIEAGMTGAQFMALRVARLYPLFLIGLLLGVAGLVWQTRLGQTDYSWLELGFALLYNLFYLPYFNVHTIQLQSITVPGEIFPFNWPAWSLFFEMAVNLLFFLNLRYFRIPTQRLLALSFIPFALIIMLNHGDAGWGSKNWFMALPRVVFGFYAGVWIYELSRTAAYQRLSQSLRRACGLWMAAIMFFLVAIAGWQFAELNRYVFLVGIMVLPFAIAAATALQTPRGWHTLFACLGYISYPVYCLHAPVIHIVEAANAQLGWGLHDWNYIWFTFGLSLGLAMILAVTVDEPLRRMLRNRLNRRFSGKEEKAPPLWAKPLASHR